MASGVMRYMEAESKAALGFGLAMGATSLIAAALFWKDRGILARIIVAITLVFVIGYFATKAAKEGLDARLTITLAASLIEAVAAFKPRRKVA